MLIYRIAVSSVILSILMIKIQMNFGEGVKPKVSVCEAEVPTVIGET